MSETKLLNCPFCGEELEVVGKGHYFAHKINGCILQHLCFEIDDEEAVERWNTRKPMEKIVERLEEMEEEYAYPDDDEYTAGHYSAYKDALKIVKEEGGINET